MKVTKKKLRELLEEYIADGGLSKPQSQLQPRNSECFDKISIVDELYECVKLVENMKTEADLRRTVWTLIQIGEENASLERRGRTVNVDIAVAYESLEKIVTT